MLSLDTSGIAFRGTPPSPRITVTDIDLDADPHPTVSLTNCPTAAPTWTAFSVADDTAVPTTTPAVPPPHRLTVTVIQAQGRWGVAEVDADEGATCAG